jgi:hypothetical protein
MRLSERASREARGEIFELFHAAAEDNEEVQKAIAQFFYKNAGLH